MDRDPEVGLLLVEALDEPLDPTSPLMTWAEQQLAEQLMRKLSRRYDSLTK